VNSVYRVWRACAALLHGQNLAYRTAIEASLHPPPPPPLHTSNACGLIVVGLARVAFFPRLS